MAIVKKRHLLHGLITVALAGNAVAGWIQQHPKQQLTQEQFSQIVQSAEVVKEFQEEQRKLQHGHISSGKEREELIRLTQQARDASEVLNRLPFEVEGLNLNIQTPFMAVENFVNRVETLSHEVERGNIRFVDYVGHYQDIVANADTVAGIVTALADGGEGFSFDLYARRMGESLQRLEKGAPKLKARDSRLDFGEMNEAAGHDARRAHSNAQKVYRELVRSVQQHHD